MKSQTTSIRTGYARRKDGLGATVCKEVRPAKKATVPKGMNSHHVSIPPEYEVILQEMYPDVSVAIAMCKFIMDRLKPAEDQDIKSMDMDDIRNRRYKKAQD